LVFIDVKMVLRTVPSGVYRYTKGYDYDEVYATLRECGFTDHVRMLREEAKAIKREAGGLRAKLRRGASPFLAESLSPSAGSLSRKSRGTIWRFSISLAA
jgi:hypothetical protein